LRRDLIGAHTNTRVSLIEAADTTRRKKLRRPTRTDIASLCWWVWTGGIPVGRRVIERTRSATACCFRLRKNPVSDCVLPYYVGQITDCVPPYYVTAFFRRSAFFLVYNESVVV